MRHQKKGKKFHRKKDQRKTLFKILGENLILKEKIITTEAKAKELKRFIEKKITKSLKGDLSSYRYLRKYFSEKATKKLIKELAPLLKERKGGYTRITKIKKRKSDSSKIAMIEIIKY